MISGYLKKVFAMVLIASLTLVPSSLAFADVQTDISPAVTEKPALAIERPVDTAKVDKALKKAKKLAVKVYRACGYLDSKEASKQYRKLKKQVNKVKKLSEKDESLKGYSRSAKKLLRTAKKQMKAMNRSLKKQRKAAASLRFNGVVYSNGWRYTWYSQNVLPGGGLRIPGRHVGNGGLIMDGKNRVCVASSSHPWGKVLNTPYGKARVYDFGCDYGTIDVYTNW